MISMIVFFYSFVIWSPFHFKTVTSLDLQSLRSYETVQVYKVTHESSKRKRRNVRALNKADDVHLNEANFFFTGYGRVFNIYLYKNDILLPPSFEILSQNADLSSYHTHPHFTHCYYRGYLTNRTSSAVVVSTCDGLDGFIKDEDEEEFVIQPLFKDTGLTHILYNKKDVIQEQDYGTDTVTNSQEDFYVNHMSIWNNSLHKSKNKLFRSGSSTKEEIILEQLSSNMGPKSRWTLTMHTPEEHHRSKRSATSTKYIEFVCIVDHLEYKYYYEKNGKDVKKGIADTTKRVLPMLNLVDSYYKFLNTRVVLNKFVIWTEGNLVPVTTNGKESIRNFEAYTQNVLFGEMKMQFDYAHLLIYKNWGSLAGMGGIGSMCSARSAAISRDITTVETAANTIAHEMGHTIGLLHTTCTCKNPPCVMGRSASSSKAQSFADCTVNKYHSLILEGQLPCLFNYPRQFYFDPVCGNGFVEKGEQCDCGTLEECKSANVSQCCNHENCTLSESAECAQGPCCYGCKFKQRGSVCRDRVHQDCDLEEHCTGTSEKCGDNFYIQDGAPCNNGSSYCYKGGCKTHDLQCEALWGPTAEKAEDWCFKDNAHGSDQWASCGKNESGQYIKCAMEDVMCGKLQCKAKPGTSLPTFPIIGTSRGKRTKWVGGHGFSIYCIQGKTSTSPDMGDPTVTGDGVKCGNQKVCMKNKCIQLPPNNCTCINGGVCNNNGNCHCPRGFACPYCVGAGSGGSIDSGAKCSNDDSTTTPFKPTEPARTTKMTTKEVTTSTSTTTILISTESSTEFTASSTGAVRTSSPTTASTSTNITGTASTTAVTHTSINITTTTSARTTTESITSGATKQGNLLHGWIPVFHLLLLYLLVVI